MIREYEEAGDSEPMSHEISMFVAKKVLDNAAMLQRLIVLIVLANDATKLSCTHYAGLAG